MSGISRIGSLGTVSRDQASNGHDAVDKAQTQATSEIAGSDDAVAKRNPDVENVAKLYEKQFLGEMMKAMRSTVSYTDQPSMAQNIYRDELDKQYVDTWGDNGGIGLSNLIYDQIMGRYFNQGAGSELKKQGPVALSDRDVSSVRQIPHSPGATQDQIPLKVEFKPSSDGGPIQLKAPWSATVVQKTQLDGRTALTLEHEGGMRSTFVFNGIANQGAENGQTLSRGQTFGLLSPDERSVLWNLNPRDKKAE